MGYFLSVISAVTWSASVIMFKSMDELSGTRMNLMKNLLSLLLMIPTFWIVEGRLLPAMGNPTDTMIVLVSGFFGIGVADALVLLALRYLPASYLAVMECLYSPFVLVLSVAFLSETPAISQLAGGLLILLAVCLVSLAEGGQRITRGVLPGILLMTAAMAMMSSGIVMIKPLLSVIPFWEVLVLRMAAGCISSWLMDRWLGTGPGVFTLIFQHPMRWRLVLAGILSAYVSLLLWVAGYLYLDAHISAMLNQTSTIFTVLFGMIFLRERLSLHKAGAVALATSGVLMIIG